MSALSSPAQVMARLQEIDADLAQRANELEDAALAWFRMKRDRELAERVAYAEASGTTVERKLAADAAGASVGADEEGAWEGKRAVVRVLETRSMIGTALLKSMGRA